MRVGWVPPSVSAAPLADSGVTIRTGAALSQNAVVNNTQQRAGSDVLTDEDHSRAAANLEHKEHDPPRSGQDEGDTQGDTLQRSWKLKGLRAPVA